MYDFDENVDYSTLIKQAISGGAPAEQVSTLLGQRMAKAKRSVAE